MEIVTEPDIRTAEQARRYAEELQLLLRSIGASDADMERGQMRVEANVSLRPRGSEPFGTRVEVKNMNSFRAVERAIAFEIERQAAALDAGEPIVQETRGWSEERALDLPDAGRRRRPTTTATSRSRTCRRSIWPTGLARRAIRAACPSCRPPDARATREVVGLTRLRRRGPGRDPDATALFEATLAAEPGARAEAGRQLGHRRLPAPAERRADRAGGRGSGRARGHRRRGRRTGSISRAQGREVLDEHVGGRRPGGAIIAARGFRQITD